MKRTAFIWLIGLVILFGALYWGISRALTTTSAAARPFRGLAVRTVAGSVTVAPEAESDLTAPEGGVLRESQLVAGRVVHTGDVVARLDQGQLPFRLEEAQLNFDELQHRLAAPLASEIQLQIFQQELTDMEPLRQAGYSAPADYTRLQLSLRQQEALAHADRADLETRRDVLKTPSPT